MLILSGNIGCGKSLLLKEIILDNNTPVQGFLSLKELTDGVVTGISLLLLPDREIVPMATTTPIETESNTTRFYFYPNVFSRINNHFETLDKDLPFVFDEFGLLEMNRKGHFPIFDNLMKSSHRTLMVVRSEILDDFISAFCINTRYDVLDMTVTDRNDAVKNILAFLSGRGGA